MSAFAQLAGALKPLVPASWRVIGVERDLDELEAGVVSVVIKLESVSRMPEAPNSGRYRVGWTVTVVQPHADPERADPAIFDACLELVRALDGIPWLAWTRAQKALESGRFAFDINVDTITTREDNPE